MSIALRVLIVEDSEDDAMIMVRELQKGGYEPAFERVDTPEAMITALATRSWDLIIADYIMPRFSGLAAFKLARETGTDVPFIIVSGKVGDDAASEAMNAGVHDYVLKDRLSRLVPAVTRELAQAESRRRRRRAEEDLDRINRALKVLSQASQLAVHAREESVVLQEVCRIAVEVGGYALAWVGYAENDGDKSVRPVAVAGPSSRRVEAIKVTWDEKDKLGRGPTGTSIRSGRPSVVKDTIADPDYLPWREEAVKHGYASSAAFPLLTEGRAFGALSIYASERNSFDTEEVRLLTELSDVLAHAIMAIRTRMSRNQVGIVLQQNEQRYRTLFNEMTEGLTLNEMIFDDDGTPCDYRFIEVNPGFERLAGLKAADIVGKTAR